MAGRVRAEFVGSTGMALAAVFETMRYPCGCKFVRVVRNGKRDMELVAVCGQNGG